MVALLKLEANIAKSQLRLNSTQIKTVVGEIKIKSLKSSPAQVESDKDRTYYGNPNLI